jgi:hypothetical protein
MLCAHCDQEFTAKNIRRRFCSARCRAAAWQANRADALALVEDALTRALTRLQEIRKCGRRG